MNKHIIPISIAFTGLLYSSIAGASDTTPWGYSGSQGPEHWGSLDPGFFICSHGKNQSPVDITDVVDAELPEIKINYKAGGVEVVNNGHSIQINYEPGSTMSVGGRTFELKQFHFHSPSENKIKGKSYAMEAHYVNADANGNLAVIAVMFEEGDENTELAKAWDYMPAKVGERQVLTSDIKPGQLLPENRDYYRFNGSLTTPPCSEGVLWLVMENTLTASKEQIEQFTNTMHFDNNRPVQPVNSRLIVK